MHHRDLHVYAATDVNSGPRGTRHLLLRRIAHSSDTLDGGLERLLSKSVDAAELALLDPVATSVRLPPRPAALAPLRVHATL